MAHLNSIDTGHSDVALESLDPRGMDEALERYLSNPMFRAARFEELVVDDNPYRRPVRPEDIGMVDFSTPLRATHFAQLSGLMAHRMLLNIYDSRKMLVPERPDEAKWRDFRRFYDPSTRFLGDLVRPHLERHVFSFVRQAARPAEGSRTAILARLGELATRRRECAAELARVVGEAADRDAMAATVAVQQLALALNLRHRPVAGVPALTEAAAAVVPYQQAVAEAGQAVRRISEQATLRTAPHAYYQYYLPSTLALMNHVNAALQDPGQVFALAGVLLAHAVDDRAVAGAGSSAGNGAGAAEPPAADVLLERVEQLAGEPGLRELSRGLEEHAVLLDVHHDDRMRQFTWINRMPYYREKAERLQKAIGDNQIAVELDTFVESWEECSTTHVHDDDRLIVIESGEMEFWNCLGVTHKYLPGDKMFVPRHRLHGSVVRSGECVYHQPVITEELDREFG